ncbi:methyltransferase type 12 [Grosmannia clavigera kw1407]|uniref:Methyltransferase type 12 n=1 Tax=Grosmannia clavigera (strain kw1407 / UAMH 11150) TaxID=655863 RepID=F0XBS5_GROCL|nr:methyltransferase type 12 [Grosmannia clavigera kw1407]EFX04982.1 methyltransferase type 12 [Grosmannia clavigera kw1407]
MAKESAANMAQEPTVRVVLAADQPDNPHSPGNVAPDTVLQDPVQVDSERVDDEGYDDSTSYENGRRYHAFREGIYVVPNDEAEQERLDLVHHIYRLLIKGELFLAPISAHPHRVLDLGTGTGIWAMDFAEQHPSAEVLGTDLSPIQPKWAPPNCIFEVDDFEQDWLYHKKFDYIHAREIAGCVSDPDQLVRRAFENLVPGGYFEIQTVYPRFVSDDGTHTKAVNAQLWIKSVCDGAAKFGKPLDLTKEWLGELKAAGFVDVHQEIRKLTIGAWPKDPALKEIGRYGLVQQQQALEAYSPGILSRISSWKDEEIQVLLAKVNEELKDPEIHIYHPIYFIWGRKP